MLCVQIHCIDASTMIPAIRKFLDFGWKWLWLEMRVAKMALTWNPLFCFCMHMLFKVTAYFKNATTAVLHFTRGSWMWKVWSGQIKPIQMNYNWKMSEAHMSFVSGDVSGRLIEFANLNVHESLIYIGYTSVGPKNIYSWADQLCRSLWNNCHHEASFSNTNTFLHNRP